MTQQTTTQAQAQLQLRTQVPTRLQTADSGKVRLGGGCRLPQPRR